MKRLATTSRISHAQLIAAASIIVGIGCLNAFADDFDTDLFVPVVPVAVPAAAPQPAAAADQAKQATPDAKQNVVTQRTMRIDRSLALPTMYPNPLAFNMTWLSFPTRSLIEARAIASRQKAMARRAALVRRPLANAAAQNAVEQQLRKMMEPMLKTELSFAARAADLNPAERQKLIASAKEWFDKYLVDFVKNSDPNQQQMILQAQQRVWVAGGQPQRVQNPRETIRAGVAKIVSTTLPKDKATVYASECRKRDEFARQVSVDNVVERIDKKVKLSPDQWKKITKSLNDHWEKARNPQLESLVINGDVAPGAHDQWILSEAQPGATSSAEADQHAVGPRLVWRRIHGRDVWRQCRSYRRHRSGYRPTCSRRDARWSVQRVNLKMNRRASTNLATYTTMALTICALWCLIEPAHAQNRFVMDENQFNSWLYQGNGQVADEDSEITLMVESVDRCCHLTEAQKDKLRLAGHGDYARFKQQVDDLRNECVGKSFDQNEMGTLYQKFQPLTARYQAGILDSTSLFTKVAHQTLTPEQREEYEAAEAERRKARHTAKVRLFVAILEQSCPLTSAQRNAMVELLLKETRPALRTSEYDWYVVVVQAAKIPDEKLEPILDKAQMTCVKKIGDEARAMEGRLKQMGVLPK